MKKALKICAAVIRAILVAACVLLAAYNLYVIISKYALGNGMPTVFGYAGARVASGSMDDGDGVDDIKVGDFVIVHAQDGYGYRDIVMFYDPSKNEYVTHRIVDIDEENGIYFICGDAGKNPVTDAVPADNIVGKVVCVMGGMGNFIDFLSTPAGLFIIIASGVVIWLLYDVVWTLVDRRKDETGKD